VCVSEYADKTCGLLGRREPVAIRILPPVETGDLSPEDVPALIERCRSRMAEAIASITPAAGVGSA